jgi:2-polyprenyl-3-methyl-5-hydroxy-6-metoxy-1,4-benzoquinol methylase
MTNSGIDGSFHYHTGTLPVVGYYEHERNDILPLLPESASSILEVGAGVGATLRWIKTIYPHASTTGVELNAELQSQLANNADVAMIGRIEERFSELKSYDLILLLDVLEHLVEPLDTLRKLSTLLRPGGRVIVSLPNVAHLSISLPLLFGRRFSYTDAGILDRTHLKFFVEETAINLLNDANLVVTKGLVSGMHGPRSRLVFRLSFGLLLHYLTKQYIMLAELNNDQAVQKRVHWELIK